jgi:bacterioferritin-associated ferredoxin
MMKKFKDLLSERAFNRPIEMPSVSVKLKQHTLMLRFDSKDIVLEAGYAGELSPWMSSLCSLVMGKSLSEIAQLNWKHWEEAFKDDQIFWDLKQEEETHFFDEHFELLKASIDIFRGREYLYQEASPLVCRCFGIRESDILEHLQKEGTPTLETLAGVSRAGMGCRSCVPQLKRWLVLHESKKHAHHFKNRPMAEWLLEIDYMLSCFPLAAEWKMEVRGMKKSQVSISFDKEVNQKEEEKVAKEIQDFLGAALDADLAFFLRRARHFAKAKG